MSLEKLFLSETQVREINALAIEAGLAIMKIYKSPSFEVAEKKDSSPVTEADLAAHHILFDALSRITPEIPIISEESEINRLQTARTYWLVDPLDGTRDFVARMDTFVVCIGLVHEGYPVAGFIHEPVTGRSWWAQQGQGAYADGVMIRNESKRTELIAAGSRSTPSARMEELYREHSITEVQRYGSASKFCHLSEGRVDLYPRFGLTSEWDTAAGQAIAEEAGCKVISLLTGERLAYGKEEILNKGGFVASRVDLKIGEELHAKFAHDLQSSIRS